MARTRPAATASAAATVEQVKWSMPSEEVSDFRSFEASAETRSSSGSGGAAAQRQPRHDMSREILRHVDMMPASLRSH